MKIICIGKNYSDHIQEMKTDPNDRYTGKPVIFMKPDTALLRNNTPFYYPAFSKDIHHEVELFIRINRVGKSIEEKFAPKYYDAIGIGIDFTARDLQSEAKKNGHPWEIAKGFDQSAAISSFIPIQEIKDIHQLNFSLEINGALRQKGNTRQMIMGINSLISYASQYFTLKKGDLIFTGTPEGVGPVHVGDHLVAYVEDKKMLDFKIK